RAALRGHRIASSPPAARRLAIVFANVPIVWPFRRAFRLSLCAVTQLDYDTATVPVFRDKLRFLPCIMRHVALLIESSGSYGRGLLQGIARYNREHEGWSTYYRPHGLNSPPPDWIADWKGDGMLVRIDTKKTAELVKRSGLPVVNLRGLVPDLPFPFLAVDNEQVAKIAAQHLQERGLRSFGF